MSINYLAINVNFLLTQKKNFLFWSIKRKIGIKEMNYLVSYEVKIGNKFLEKSDKSENVFFSLGDCIAWLNTAYDKVYNYLLENDKSFLENLSNKQIFFLWKIQDSTSTYEGTVELDTVNFLQKVLKIDLLEYKKQDTIF